MVAIKRYLEPEIAKEAEERMKAGKPSEDSSEGARTRDIIADYVGVHLVNELVFNDDGGHLLDSFMDMFLPFAARARAPGPATLPKNIKCM